MLSAEQLSAIPTSVLIAEIERRIKNKDEGVAPDKATKPDEGTGAKPDEGAGATSDEGTKSEECEPSKKENTQGGQVGK